MKIILITMIIITSCSSRKYMFSDKEMGSKGYSIDKWGIKQNDVIIAKLKSIEWELYESNLVREISVTTVNQLTDKQMIEIIKFLHTKYPDFKIEVNNDTTLFFD